MHQIDQNRTLRALKNGSVLQSLSAYWQQLDLSPALHHVRITGETLSYILEVLDTCQGIHFVQESLGRDGCRVAVKSFWKDGAEFVYWAYPKGLTVRIADVVWLLADYLPRPARDSLQNSLPPEDVCRLLKKLHPVHTVANDPLAHLQAVIPKGDPHAED